MKTLEYFLRKQVKINNAVERVNKILIEFTEGKRDPERWNEVHDLKDRLIDRLYNNWSDYKDWHYAKYEFNVYSV